MAHLVKMKLRPDSNTKQSYNLEPARSSVLQNSPNEVDLKFEIEKYEFSEN